MKFGDYIRQKRETTGWTQPEAAAKADIEQSYLSKLETGKSYPSEEVFNKLVNTLDLNIEEMARTVGSQELTRLREIKDVRAIVLQRQQNQQRFMRSWLIAGLVMLVIAGGVLGMSISMVADAKADYMYRSEGVILEGEPTNVFELIKLGARPSVKPLKDRIAYDFQKLEQHQGNEYIKPVEGGYRHYQLYASMPQYDFRLIGWHLTIGFMLLFGGLASFYIARRWQ
ncbi:helix-turn-helix domain-containing protein [Kordiimonas aquimaris]|uniref:helix-turn-helix domain-containing protein n=1 Tax=Kordiimonas aquimaris TaxID=707591 RepID=UPI0021CE19AA|nr:helix-turn-helix transcriptional regulator [Kordiimonas aquimaris]